MPQGKGRRARGGPPAEGAPSRAGEPYSIDSWGSEPHPDGGETLTVVVRRRGETEAHEFSWAPGSHATEDEVRAWLANWASS